MVQQLRCGDRRRRRRRRRVYGGTRTTAAKSGRSASPLRISYLRGPLLPPVVNVAGRAVLAAVATAFVCLSFML
jgi:hypothetical protein